MLSCLLVSIVAVASAQNENFAIRHAIQDSHTWLLTMIHWVWKEVQ